MDKILIIEDDYNVRENLKEYFDLHNYDVVTAVNGVDGIEKTYLHKPDLIICDISMPELDGFEVLEILRKNTSTFFTPFLFLTAMADNINMRHGMNLGADDYIVKPYNNDEILNAVESKLKKYQTTKENLKKRFINESKHFPSNLPLQLTNPLQNIIGFSNILRDNFTSFPNEDIVSIINNIEESAIKLIKMVNNVRFIDRLSNPSHNYIQDAVPFENFEEFLINKAKLTADRFGKASQLILIINEINQTSIRMYFEDIEKLIDELLDNAFRFSYPEKSVTIIGHRNKHHFELKVSNYSRGINHEKINNLENRNSKDILEQDNPYNGLGLTLIKLIVEAYGGKVLITSVPYEETTIAVSLPI